MRDEERAEASVRSGKLGGSRRILLPAETKFQFGFQGGGRIAFCASFSLCLWASSSIFA
jgi:hypothetical protein